MELIISVTSRQKVYSYESNDGYLDQWTALTTLSSNFSNCNGYNILGGSGSFDMHSSLMRYFELKPHYRLLLEINFFRIDSWDSDGFTILLDHQQIYQNTFSYASGINLCGDSAFDDQIILIKIQAQHNSNFVSVEMNAQDINNDNNESWGISTFNLYIEPCPEGCDFCESGKGYCQQWSLQYWDQRVTHHYYYDLKLYQTYDCSSSCSYGITLSQHHRVMIRFRILVYSTQDIYYDVILNNQIHVNKYVFGSSVFFALYEGAQLDFLHAENYMSINIQRTGGSYAWLYIKDFQVLIWKDDQKIQLLTIGCSKLIGDSCWDCENGWILDNTEWHCVPKQQYELNLIDSYKNEVIGQDNYLISKNSVFAYSKTLFNSNILFSVLCENGWKFDNILSACVFSQAKNMKFQNNQKNYYSLELEQNNFGKCQNGWIFDQIVSLCVPFCGDYLVLESEQCDDGNQIHFDGCFDCQFECILYCSDCQYGICKACQIGFHLENDACTPICGDGLLIPYVEQCDDENTESDDGCYECKYDCTQDCVSCNSEVCLKCRTGFSSKLKACIPTCGDLIITPEYEECDDGNDELYDGCFQCNYSCHPHCRLCEKGKCLDQCLIGEIIIDNKCESVCGNKVVTGAEQCDDGNNIQNDGCDLCQFSCPQFCDYCEKGICYECQEKYQLNNNICITANQECNDYNDQANDGCYEYQVQVNWICNDATPSECSFQQNPKIILTYLNQTFSVQYVELTFTQQVKIIEQDHLNIQYFFQPDQKQQIIQHPIHKLTSNLNNVNYFVQIDFTQQSFEKSILFVTVSDNIVNQYNMSIIDQTKQLALLVPKYMNSQQLFYTQQILNIDKNIIYGLGAISIMTFLFGESSFLKEVLNSLQYLSYLKFINIQYPENLCVFFQISDLLSIGTLLQFLHLDQYLNGIYLKEENMQTSGKFAFYQQEADLIINLTCQILQMVGLVFLYCCFELFKKGLYGGSKIARPVYFLSLCAKKLKDNFTFEINRELYKFWRQFYRIEILLSIRGLRSIILINSWDLLFKTFLFIGSMKLNNIRDYLSVSFSLLILSIYIAIIFECLQTILNQTCIKQKNYLKLFEIITLCRQMVFQALLVFLQFNQVLQTILISINNLTYLLILQFNHDLKKHVNIDQKIIEGTIVLFTLSSFLHFDDFEQYLNYNNKIYLSFAQIGILSFALVVQLFKFIVQKSQQLARYIRSKFAIKEIGQKKIYAQHSLFI